MEESLLSQPKCTVAVLGRKGGVGKTSVTVALALRAVQQGKRVGVLDLNLSCPSVHHVLLGGQPRSVVYGGKNGWIPITALPAGQNTASTGESSKGAKVDETSSGDNVANNDTAVGDPANRAPSKGGGALSVFSVALLFPPEQSVSYAWLPHRKKIMVGQLLNNVLWGDVDLLLIDTPPSVGEVHTALLDYLRRIDNSHGLIVASGKDALSLAAMESDVMLCGTYRISLAGVVLNKALREEAMDNRESANEPAPETKDDAEDESAGQRLHQICSKYNVPVVGQLGLRKGGTPSQEADGSMLETILTAVLP